MCEKATFPRGILVSAAVSKLGKTSIYLIDQGVSIDAEYYCGLMSEMIPEMTAQSGGDFTFQQDGARAHTARHTLAYFAEHLPETASLLEPDNWPPCSPDLNPMDYAVWGQLGRLVYKVKIRDLEHLADRIGEAWAELQQDFIDKTINSFIKRVKACIDANGGHFEYLLK